MAGVLATSFVEAQEKPTIDKLQTEERKETVKTLQAFMHQIWDLDRDVQDKLLRARFLNASLTFAFADAKKLQNDEWAGGGDAKSDLETGEKWWTLTSTVVHCTDRSWSSENGGTKSCHSYLDSKLVVDVWPDADMLDWMKKRDEYTGYSKDEIGDDALTLDLSGKIYNVRLKITSNCDDADFEGCRPNARTLTLTVTMHSITPTEFKIDTARNSFLHGTVRVLANYLMDATTKWVNYLMGKGNRPDRIFSKEKP